MHLDEKKVVLNFDFPKAVSESIKQSISDFERETSWQVTINENTNTNAAEPKTHSESAYSVAPQDFEGVPMEQNKALHYIELTFSDQKDKPYKKSIKGRSQMELCFLSPTVGLRYVEKLKLIANEIGWHLSVGQIINQNELTARAIQLCQEKGILLMKTPSYNPVTSAMSVKIAQGADEDMLAEIKEKFYSQTGCHILFL